MTAPTTPATPATGGRRPSPLRPIAAIVGYTLRTALPGRRWIGVLLPCVAAVLFGLLARGLDGDPTTDFVEVANVALFALVLPVTCLVVGDAVLGAEVRSGSFAFTWMSPVPTWQIAVGRWLGGTVVAAGCLAAAFAASAAVAGIEGSMGPMALAAAVGAMAYVAVFVAIGCVARRAAAWSLAFVFLVERLLGAALAGIAQLSPAWLARNVHAGLADVSEDLVRESMPQGWGAVVRLLVVTAVALALAANRLRTMRLTGSAD